MSFVQRAFNELIVCGPISMAVTVGANLDLLLTALVTFGVSLVTVVGGEVIRFLSSYFKKKTKELEDKEDKKE